MIPTQKRKMMIRSSKAVPHAVALTALLYLKEALLAERYEECAFYIQIAREFAASPAEVRYLLEDPRRQPRAG